MLIAAFQLEHEAVALEQTFEEVPEMQIEAERIAAHSTEWTMPSLWASYAESTSIREALEADPSVNTIVTETEFGDEVYYQIEWSDSVQDQISTYVDKSGSITKASGTPDGWRLRIRFGDRNQFDMFLKTLSEQEYSYRLLELRQPDEPRVSVAGLTERQREALVAAFHNGYYEIPREISGDEIAAKLDISQQTLSELLRRGTNKIIKSQLVTTEEHP